jgi:hypothetical protein
MSTIDSDPERHSHVCYIAACCDCELLGIESLLLFLLLPKGLFCVNFVQYVTISLSESIPHFFSRSCSIKLHC